MSWFRRVFKLERIHPVLKDIPESNEASIFCYDSTYILHFRPLLRDAVEFFEALVIMLSKVSDKNSAGSTRSLCTKLRTLLSVGRRLQYLVMDPIFETFFINAMAKCQRIVRNILRVVVV